MIGSTALRFPAALAVLLAAHFAGPVPAQDPAAESPARPIGTMLANADALLVAGRVAEASILLAQVSTAYRRTRVDGPLLSKEALAQVERLPEPTRGLVVRAFARLRAGDAAGAREVLRGAPVPAPADAPSPAELPPADPPPPDAAEPSTARLTPYRTGEPGRVRTAILTEAERATLARLPAEIRSELSDALVLSAEGESRRAAEIIRSVQHAAEKSGARPPGWRDALGALAARVEDLERALAEITDLVHRLRVRRSVRR